MNETGHFGGIMINNVGKPIAWNGAHRQFGTNGSATVIGPVNGSFYGPSAIETGGSFNLEAASGSRYLATGIFAGR